MTILITGGAGFIGRALIEKLKKDNPREKIFVIDNFVSSDIKTFLAIKEKYVNWFVQRDVCEVDIRYLFDRIGEFETGKIREIYHLACPASPKIYQKNPVKTIETCVIGTQKMIELARSCDAKMLFTSTSEIYGDPLDMPQAESYRGNVNCFGPRACYDEGKRTAETLCYEAIQRGVDVKVARIFNTYGPGMSPDDGRVISNFVKQTLDGSPITIYGSGKQTRSFCFIDDMVDGLIKLMASSANEPINLGNPKEFYRILDVAKKIQEIVCGDAFEENFSYTDLPEDDPTHRQPDIIKARSLLAWEPKISLEEGINKIIAD